MTFLNILYFIIPTISSNIQVLQICVYVSNTNIQNWPVSLFQMTTSATLCPVCTVGVVRTRLTGTPVSARQGTLDSTVKEVSIIKLYPPVS